MNVSRSWAARLEILWPVIECFPSIGRPREIKETSPFPLPHPARQAPLAPVPSRPIPTTAASPVGSSQISRDSACVLPLFPVARPCRTVEKLPPSPPRQRLCLSALPESDHSSLLLLTTAATPHRTDRLTGKRGGLPAICGEKPHRLHAHVTTSPVRQRSSAVHTHTSRRHLVSGYRCEARESCQVRTQADGKKFLLNKQFLIVTFLYNKNSTR